MSHSAENASPVSLSMQDGFDSLAELTPVFTSLNDWAEFSALFQRLDEEYAETLAAPLLHLVDKPG
jgi:hypothetical protein